MASIYPVYIALLNITDSVPDVSVTLMTETQTGCLHNYTLLPGDMKRLETCDIFVVNGAGMEGFIDRVLANRADLPIIDSSQGIHLLESDADHSEESDGEEEDPGHEHDVNAHIWSSVTRHIRQVENITDSLCAYDVVHAAQYRENGERYVAQLETLRANMQEQLRDAMGQPVIAFHEAFSYFADEFDLALETVIEEEPDESPSPQRIKVMVALVKGRNVRWLIVERNATNTSAQVIAKEAGCELLAFDPVITGAQDPSAYLTGMEQNALMLRQALTKE